LQKKLKNAALVQESLKNLMLATEDNPDDEDGELLGAIVNGQAIGYQRKRWKLSA
jgi:transcription initiation factor TFIID subunit 8